MNYREFLLMLEAVTTSELGASILLLALIFCVRWLLLRFINNDEDLSTELKLRWTNLVRNLVIVFALFGMMVIWAPELRSLALSLTAFAVAMVVATKELILCVMGSFVRAGSRNFYVGDLIELQGQTGYVIDQSLLTTTISQLGDDSLSYNGRVLTYPNSVFLASPVRNLSRLRPYVVHTFALTFEPAMISRIQDIVRSVEQVQARRWKDMQQEPEFRLLLKQKRFQQNHVAPQIRLTTTDVAKVRLLITCLCRFKERIHMEKEIALAAWQHLPEPGQGLDTSRHPEQGLSQEQTLSSPGS